VKKSKKDQKMPGELAVFREVQKTEEVFYGGKARKKIGKKGADDIWSEKTRVVLSKT